MYNEAPQAAAVAAHLGTEHHELYVSAEEAMDAVRRMPSLYSEPFADSSQVPMYGNFPTCKTNKRHLN